MVDIQFYTLLKQIMGKFYIMRGNPKDEFNNEELEKSWDKIPSTIRNFIELFIMVSIFMRVNLWG